MMKTIKKMPVHVLSAKNKSRKKPIVEEEDGVVRLLVKPADLKERAEILGACRPASTRLCGQARRGHLGPQMAGLPCGRSMRFKVLEAGGRRCALCGITSKDRALDVDHIVPHSKGGPSTFENLQILCSKCNRSKGNRSQTDFRAAEPPAPGLADCALCTLPPLTEFPSENDLARAVGSLPMAPRPSTSSPSATSPATSTSLPTRSSPCTICCALHFPRFRTTRSLFR